jgi:hypothetical protein
MPANPNQFMNSAMNSLRGAVVIKNENSLSGGELQGDDMAENKTPNLHVRSREL